MTFSSTFSVAKSRLAEFEIKGFPFGGSTASCVGLSTTVLAMLESGAPKRASSGHIDIVNSAAKKTPAIAKVVKRIIRLCRLRF